MFDDWQYFRDADTGNIMFGVTTEHIFEFMHDHRVKTLMTRFDFINALAPAACASAKITKIPAGFVIADAALESGWGSSQLTLKARNLFGVKADAAWHGPVLQMLTREFYKGHWCRTTCDWRKYDTWAEAIADHAQFLLTNPRYKPAFQFSGSDAFARAVAAAGYATDPAYGDKVCAIIDQNNLTQYDI